VYRIAIFYFFVFFDGAAGYVVSFFFSSRRRHTRYWRDWSSDVCSSDLINPMSTETSADDGLIRAAAEGDRSAFGELYLRYARMVHGILLARVPAGDAEDLVQDVFMSAMRQLRLLRTAAAFRGWLAAIARNRAIDYFRESKQRADFDERTEREHGVAANQDAFQVLELIR